MPLEHYYNSAFRLDMARLFQGIPFPEARIVALGMSWVRGCTLLERIEHTSRPQFLACLYITVLVDQAMHSHCRSFYQQFEALTLYPKFRVGLGHPGYINPIQVMELPINQNLVDQAEIGQLIPETMQLLVSETSAFFRDHIPELSTRSFFEKLLKDPDFSSGTFDCLSHGTAKQVPASLRQLAFTELESILKNSINLE